MDLIEQAIHDGDQAEAALESPILQKALAAIRSEQIDAFSGSNPLASDVREAAYHMLRALDALEVKLRAYKSNGTIEKDRIKKRGNR